MKLDLNDVILEPVLSEKSTKLTTINQYVFKVHQKANKKMVKEALESLFDVKVDRCNVLNNKGKKRNTRKRTTTYMSGSKKAIVTLKEGEFDFFETMQ